MSASLSPVSPPAVANAISVRDVSFFRDNEVILDAVNLEVEPGEFLAMLGPNGGGKTTLLRLILGLMPPDSGSVLLFGGPPCKARSKIGYVPQFSTIRQDFPATVLETTLMGGSGQALRSPFRRLLWRTDKPAREKAMALLDRIGIADLAAHPVRALSGGQRQRLLLARALMGREDDSPFLLLLDEPTASIDPEGKGCFLELCAELKQNITMVMVSHELGMASPFFSHIALVNRTLTVVPGGCPDSETVRAFIGAHAPDCPVSRMVLHSPACGCGSPDRKTGAPS